MKINVENKVLLFDFDGTLVETEFLAKRVIDHYFKQLKLPFEAPFSEMIVGRTWKAATEGIVNHAKAMGVTLDPPEILAEEFKRLYRAEFKNGIKVIPGLKECLPKFRSKAKFIGIVTGSERVEVEEILAAHQLSHYFDRIWAFGDYEHSKPDPSPYLQALKDTGATPAEVLVFEDSKAGMESSFRAGLSWIQITHEEHAKDADSRSLRVISDWIEITDELD